MEEFISLGNKAASLKTSIMEVAANKCLKMGTSGVFYSGREIITFCIECCEEMFHSENVLATLLNQKTGEITVWDNGGIPVIIHEEHKTWIPELIFSNLRAGSNFDDTENRIVAGTNGVGASLTNIFSKRFSIKTADGKNQFLQVFTENMSKRTTPKIINSEKNFTEISYIVDLEKFGMSDIDEFHIEMIRKRLIDIAACNTGIKIQFNSEKYKFKNFKEYAELYSDLILYEKSENWEIGFSHSSSGLQSTSFVNSVETKDGGTHVEYILHQITQWLREKIKKKYKVEVKPSELKNHMFLFVEASIVNSGFSSQTKEKLITEPKDFGSYHEVSENILKLVFNSEIIKQSEATLYACLSDKANVNDVYNKTDIDDLISYYPTIEQSEASLFAGLS
jgi:DNA topoisomerase-2